MATPFTPFYTGDLLETQRPGERTIMDIPTTWGEGFGAQFTDAWQGSPGPMLFRWAGRQGAIYDQSPTLQPEEANRRFSFAGQPELFSEPITEARARDLYEINRARLRRESTIQRSSLGDFGAFVAALGGGALDPLNIAAGIVPGMVAARFGVEAAMIGARGSIASRAAWGAVEGATGTALILPLWIGLSQEERRPFTSTDAFMAIVFGTVLGAGLHAGVATFQKWRRNGTPMPPIEQILQDTSAENRALILRGSVGNVMEGRPVDVSPLIDNIFQTSLRRRGDSPTLARAVETAEGRIAGEEVGALRRSVRDVARAERGDSTAALSARIAEIDRTATSIKADAAEARTEGFGRRTAFQLSEIDQHIADPRTPEAQKAVLRADRREIVKAANADTETNLEVLRALSESQGLETAASRLTRERDKIAGTIAKRQENVAAAQEAFRKATGRAADRRDVLQALTERTLRRAIGDKIQGNVRTIPAEEFVKSALRIMGAERYAAAATIQAELQRLGVLGGMALREGSATAAPGAGRTSSATAGLPGEGTPGTVNATGATAARQAAITDIARRNASPYLDPEGLAASRAADEAVAAAGAVPIKARSVDQGIGAESPMIRELDELTAVDEAMVADMRALGTLTEGEARYIDEAGELVAKAELNGKVRDLAAICFTTGAP